MYREQLDKSQKCHHRFHQLKGFFPFLNALVFALAIRIPKIQDFRDRERPASSGTEKAGILPAFSYPANTAANTVHDAIS
jgi:hypothetical protein